MPHSRKENIDTVFDRNHRISFYVLRKSSLDINYNLLHLTYLKVSKIELDPRKNRLWLMELLESFSFSRMHIYCSFSLNVIAFDGYHIKTKTNRALLKLASIYDSWYQLETIFHLFVPPMLIGGRVEAIKGSKKKCRADESNRKKCLLRYFVLGVWTLKDEK